MIEEWYKINDWYDENKLWKDWALNEETLWGKYAGLSDEKVLALAGRQILDEFKKVISMG
jgi:hypothetical protein